MQVVLRQIFPLGRFHATPWRANPFDDTHGEWPPSPWRLLRAITARWYQWRREEGLAFDDSLDLLVGAFCASRVSFHLPGGARRAPGLRQYQPAEFSWQPRSKTKKVKGDTVQVPGMKAYGTTLVQDNYWSVAPDEPVWWWLNGDGWDEGILDVLDRSLERLVYFGRAETLTECGRWTAGLPAGSAPNCFLEDDPASVDHVPVLAAQPDATRVDIERVTDHPTVRERTVPPGARWMFARLPERPRVYERRSVSTAAAKPLDLVQFAIASAVVPEPRATCRLTSRFRERMLNGLARHLSRDSQLRWRQAPVDVATRLARMSGLGINGIRLQNHEHAYIAVWFSGAIPERLLVWRFSPFEHEELDAILRAARADVSWGAVPRNDAWSVRLLPLDPAVPAPPGFEGTRATDWASMTPYVPPRHRFRRDGRERPAEDAASQLRRSLGQIGLPSSSEQLSIDVSRTPRWTAVHVPPERTRKRPFHGDRIGFMARLSFQSPVSGPIMVGHSSHFGLGLFRPEDASQQGNMGGGGAHEAAFRRGRSGGGAP